MTLRRVAVNSSWWISEKAALLLTSLATSIALVRLLGAAGYGSLSYLLAVVGLLAPLAQFGISGLVARALLERPDQERAILGTALVLRLLGAAIALLAGLAYWLLAEDASPERAVLLVLLLAQLASSLQVVEFWFQARLKAGALAPWRTAVMLVAALAKILVAWQTRSATAVAWVFAAEYLAIGLTQLVAYTRASGKSLRPQLARPWVGWFAGRAPWLLLSGLAEIIYLRIDIVMLERMRGLEETGIYAVAARLSEIWYAVPAMLAASMFPVLWERRHDPQAYSRSLQTALDSLVVPAFLLAILVQLLAGPLIELLFGGQFAASAAVLRVHIWAGLFIFMRALLSRWLIAEDLLRFSLVTHLSGAILNVALNLLLIPAHGPMGAAIATVISYAVAGWLALFFAATTRPMAVMMTRSLLLPLRLDALRAYRARLTGRRGAE